MSKRRNPKKEKALRNRAYARQFRKRKNNDRFSKNRWWSKSSNQSQEKEEGTSSTEAT